MKNLTWIPLLAGLALAGACGGDDDDSYPDAHQSTDAFVPTIDAAPTIDAPPVTGAAITVNWPLVSGVDSTPGAACPAGATTAQVDFDNQGGDDIVSRFDCVDQTGIETIPPGDYIVWVTLLNTDKTQTFAMSFEYDLHVAVGDTVGTITAPINIDSGFFGLTWSFTPGTRNCGTVGADGVSILATIADTTTALDTILSCTDGGGITDPVALSDNGYVIQVTLLAGDTPLGASQARNADPFRWASEVVDLGNFEFAVQ